VVQRSRVAPSVVLAAACACALPDLPAAPPTQPAVCSAPEPAPSAKPEDRERAALLFRQGMASVRACHYAEGIALLDRAESLVPARGVVFNIGRAYDESGDAASAIRYYRAYLATSPCDASDVTARIAQLESKRAASTTASATPDLRACARRLFREGMTDIAAKQYEQGIAKLKQANLAVPAPQVLYNIGRAYRDEGDVGSSLQYLRLYVATNPPDRDSAQREIDELEERAK
jgi:tetratricopeptide (TPR) repeat protein